MLKYSDWITGPEARLDEILAAKEERVVFCRDLLNADNAVISFQMNIAGPVKAYPLAEYFFRKKAEELRDLLSSHGIGISRHKF